jgi:pimeloyl-ACP methyl ester carboxylesterase
MSLEPFRKYGQPPFNVVVVHGGPGAPGEMAPVAQELSNYFGVVEPFQTQKTIAGQVEELYKMIDEQCQTPVILLGHSWGAWLSCLFASEFPGTVKKLFLISAGAFDNDYNQNLMETRLNRLNDTERVFAEELLLRISQPGWNENIADFKRFGKLLEKADSFDPMEISDPVVEFQPHVFSQIWIEAAKLRSSGELLKSCRKIKCPVVAFHGNFDPHPYKGVIEPLSEIIRGFRFILLKNCGHYPWKEKQAKNDFFKILSEELKTC